MTDQDTKRGKIGPDGKFAFGRPINPHDRGGLYAGFRVMVIDGKPYGLMKFGTAVSWLAGTPDKMQEWAAHVRSEITRAFGNLPYDKSTLPIKVTANTNDGVIELKLPEVVGILAANPEMWLALAEVIDEQVAIQKARVGNTTGSPQA